jgi:hypothetical protein
MTIWHQAHNDSFGNLHTLDAAGMPVAQRYRYRSWNGWPAPTVPHGGVSSKPLSGNANHDATNVLVAQYELTMRALTHTHTGKTGAGSNSGAGCNVNKWVFPHAAGPAELPVRQINVPDLNPTSRAPGRRPAYQFQCKCTGTRTRVWTCRYRTTVLNTSVCTKLRFLFLCTNIFLMQRSKSNWPPAAVIPVRVKNSTTGAGSDSGKKPVCVQAPWR